MSLARREPPTLTPPAPRPYNPFVPSLLIIDRQNQRTEIEIALPFFTIGRSSACTVQIDDHGLSKRHARLYQTGEGYCVIDAGSKNGVVVNGTKVERALLRPGDHIRLGGVSIHWDAAGLVPSATGDPATPAAVADSLREQFGTDRYAHYAGPLRLKPDEVDLDAAQHESGPPTADPAPLELADPDTDPPPPSPPPARAPVSGLASTERVQSPRPPDVPLGALHLKGVPHTRARTAPDVSPELPAAPLASLPPTARIGIDPPLEAGPVLDEVDRALARLAAERDDHVPEPSLRTFAALALAHVRAGAGAVGPRAIAVATGCAVGLVAMIVHARTVIDSRWHDGPAVAVAPIEDPLDDEALAAQMFREADALRAARPDLADALLERLVREHPDSGWADLARVRLARPDGAGSGSGSAGASTRDQEEKALEQEYTAGRAAVAIEGLARLEAAARAQGDSVRANRLESRRAMIEAELMGRFDAAAKDLPALAQAGEVELLARRALELLAAHPLPAVKRRLDELLAQAAQPTPERLCRRLVGALLREDSDAATRLLEAATAERDLAGISAEVGRLKDLVKAQRRFVELADRTLRERPVWAPPELGLAAGSMVCGWGSDGLLVRTGEVASVKPFADVTAALRYQLLKHAASKLAVAGDLAAYALLRDLRAAYDEALAQAKKSDRAFAQRAAWIEPLADWYRRMLR